MKTYNNFTENLQDLITDTNKFLIKLNNQYSDFVNIKEFRNYVKNAHCVLDDTYKYLKAYKVLEDYEYCMQVLGEEDLFEIYLDNFPQENKEYEYTMYYEHFDIEYIYDYHFNFNFLNEFEYNEVLIDNQYKFECQCQNDEHLSFDKFNNLCDEDLHANIWYTDVSTSGDLIDDKSIQLDWIDIFVADSNWSFDELLQFLSVMDHKFVCQSDNGFYIEYDYYIDQFAENDEYELDKIDLCEFNRLSEEDVLTSLWCIYIFTPDDVINYKYLQSDWIDVSLADSNWAYDEILQNISIIDHRFVKEGGGNLYIEYDDYSDQFIADNDYELDKIDLGEFECIQSYEIIDDLWLADHNWTFEELLQNISILDHKDLTGYENNYYFEYDYYIDQFIDNDKYEPDKIDLGKFDCLQPYEIADVFFLANSDWTFEEVIQNYSSLECIQLCINKNGDFYVESGLSNKVDKYFNKFVSLSIEIFEKQGYNYSTVVLHFHNLIIHKTTSIFEIKYHVYDNLKQDKNGRNLLLFEDINPNLIIEFIEWYIDTGECLYCTNKNQ